MEIAGNLKTLICSATNKMKMSCIWLILYKMDKLMVNNPINSINQTNKRYK